MGTTKIKQFQITQVSINKKLSKKLKNIQVKKDKALIMPKQKSNQKIKTQKLTLQLLAYKPLPSLPASDKIK